MNVIKSRFVYHLMAIITVVIWGTTFVSTKILIQHGLSPSDIFFYRFTLAYKSNNSSFTLLANSFL